MLHFSEQDVSNLHDLDMGIVLDHYGLEPYTNGKYLCPFHEDHSPSLFFNKKKNRCECYVCNKKWDSIEFVKDYEKIDFPKALITLVDISGGDSSQYQKKSTERKRWRRLKKEERLLLGINNQTDNVDYPSKPIKSWSFERTEKGECFPNYTDNPEFSYYDGYLVLNKGMFSENYLYSEYNDVYRLMVCSFLTKTIEKVKKKYEEGKDMSKQIVILNTLIKDFQYNKKSPL